MKPYSLPISSWISRIIFGVHLLLFQALMNVPHLQKLELQYNHLEEFSCSVFRNTSLHPDTPLFLNLSHNSIRYKFQSFAVHIELNWSGVYKLHSTHQKACFLVLSTSGLWFTLVILPAGIRTTFHMIHLVTSYQLC